MTGSLFGGLLLSSCSTSSSGSDAATDAPPSGTITEPFTGLIACDGGGGPPVSTACTLTLPLSGAVSGTFTGPWVCTATPGLVDAGLPGSTNWNDNSGSSEINLSLSFIPASLPPDQLGTFPLFTTSVDLSTDAGAQQWSAANCSLTITGSVCSPTVPHPHRRVISGTGTCPQPAVQVLGNPTGPVTIGAFDFVGFIDPP